jgi:HK97 family phage prohead protease
MDFVTERLPLGEVNESLADKYAEKMDRKPSEIEFIRKGLVVKAEPNDEERSTTELINTPAVDRDKEILVPRGADLSHYQSNPQVLWAHNYQQPPIGRAAWVKKKTEGLLAKTIYAATAFADEVWTLVKGGFLPGRSVGFIPLEAHEPDEKEIRKYPERAEARRIIDKWELLEYSVVPVPSNRQALQQAIAKGLNLSEDLAEQLGVPEEGSELEEMEPDPTRVVKLYHRVEDTGRRVRDTGKRVKIVRLPDKSLDAKHIIEYTVGQELRRKRGRIT